MTSPIPPSPFARLEEERQIRIESLHPNGSPQRIYFLQNLQLRLLYCQKETFATLYPSGNIEFATLAEPVDLKQRVYFGTMSLLTPVELPAKTTVLCKDEPASPIVGYQLSKMTWIQGVPCAKDKLVLFDEQGYLSRATLAERVWLPGKPPFKAGEEIHLQKGQIIEPPLNPKIEALWQGFLK